VRYLRSPILDTEIPEDPAQMRTIQAHLHSELAAGRRVYVHCRAGIGRTGMVVGCYLAEQGLKGPAALRRLNRLWRQSERSRTWPVVPQTHEQAEFIRQWSRQK
jgi:protein-tyrosine phosphatase